MPFDRPVDDRGRTLFDRQIAGDDAAQMQRVARAHDGVAHDGALNSEIAIHDDRPLDLSVHGLHEASFAATSVSQIAAPLFNRQSGFRREI
jgi:hypothetical protein